MDNMDKWERNISEISSKINKLVELNNQQEEKYKGRSKVKD